MSGQLPTYTRSEVAKHCTQDSAWIIIDDGVYDVTKFAAMHPAGENIIMAGAGKDQTKDFWGLHRGEVLDKFKHLRVGNVEGVKPLARPTWSDVSPIMYAEAPHMRNGWNSPFHKPDLKEFRLAVRRFIEENVKPWADRAEETEEQPSDEFMQMLGREGFLAALLGPGPHLKIPPRLPGGVKPEEFGPWHEAVLLEEWGRLCSYGPMDGVGGGLCIGLTVVMHFHHDRQVAERITRETLLGEKRICLAVTEPFAGSDVAGVRLTAARSPDGTHYVLNGVKKWITTSRLTDYIVTLARTGGPGAGGLSYLIVERKKVEGITVKPLNVLYQKSAGTSLVVYEDVKVPASMLVGGKEGQGFAQAMVNFSKERLFMVNRQVGMLRAVMDETWRWGLQREAFGRPLIEQPVVAFKIGELTARIEALTAWYEAITHQMAVQGFKKGGENLSGDIALLKYESTRVGTLVADTVPDIFGGRGLTQQGMGRIAARFLRTFKFPAILGGDENILCAQGVKLALRAYAKTGQQARL